MTSNASQVGTALTSFRSGNATAAALAVPDSHLPRVTGTSLQHGDVHIVVGNTAEVVTSGGRGCGTAAVMDFDTGVIRRHVTTGLLGRLPPPVGGSRGARPVRRLITLLVG